MVTSGHSWSHLRVVGGRGLQAADERAVAQLGLRSCAKNVGKFRKFLRNFFANLRVRPDDLEVPGPAQPVAHLVKRALNFYISNYTYYLGS